jgi:hypothetical protein
MKRKYLQFLLPVLIGAAGCATQAPVSVLKRVGPEPGQVARNSAMGFLQVYSARERVPTDVNAEEFFWDNDSGRNEFLHYVAHTSYILYGPDGRQLPRVSNATGMNDPSPALVKLSPGVYMVEALAEDYDEVTLRVKVPVRIEPGLSTVVHLDGNWNPAISSKEGDEMVWLPNGHIVGWHAVKPGDAGHPTGANT